MKLAERADRIAGTLITPAGPREGWLEITGGRIVHLADGPAPADARRVPFISPGFVDIHIHGGGGAAFQSGEPEQVRRVVSCHRAHGTTTMLASLVTSDLDSLQHSVAALTAVVDEEVVAGIHLEGPFLSAARCGAHDARLLRRPTGADLDRLLAAGRGSIKMVTLAPELDGGIDAIRRIVHTGAVAAIGHTDASYAVVCDAIDAGARVATHLFNAMPPIHHREPGPILALVQDERVAVELINDGVHLHPALVRGVFRAANLRGRLALITDAMAAAGSADGRYQLGATDVDVVAGVARTVPGGAIAGSTLTMDRAVRHAVNAGVDIADALAAATSIPARAIGLDDQVGALAEGRQADLVLLSDELTILEVLQAGVPVGPTERTYAMTS